MDAIVLTVDQRSSRTGPDRVPEVLASLEAPVAASGLLLPFERTVGDEVQGVLTDPETTMTCLQTLLRADAWNIGVGIGEIDEPLPDHARAGRGPAYLFARDAVTRSKSAPCHLRVVGADDYRSEQLETVLWLWSAVLTRRSARGWEVADLVDEGLSYEAAGRRLGISQSAVSQRAQAAGLTEGRRAFTLGAQMLATMLGSAPQSESGEE